MTFEMRNLQSLQAFSRPDGIIYPDEMFVAMHLLQSPYATEEEVNVITAQLLNRIEQATGKVAEGAEKSWYLEPMIEFAGEIANPECRAFTLMSPENKSKLILLAALK